MYDSQDGNRESENLGRRGRRRPAETCCNPRIVSVSGVRRTGRYSSPPAEKTSENEEF